VVAAVTHWTTPVSHVTQTITVGDGSGKRGNCLQAAVASLMGTDLENVPDFANQGDVDETGYGVWWDCLFYGYFVKRGYLIRSVGLHGKPIPHERCLLHGDSPRGNGIKHTVVAEAGEIVWDPHPSRDGLATINGAWLPESILELYAIVRAWEERS
jgi:hypothetical protein